MVSARARCCAENREHLCPRKAYVELLLQRECSRKKICRSGDQSPSSSPGPALVTCKRLFPSPCPELIVAASLPWPLHWSLQPKWLQAADRLAWPNQNKESWRSHRS